jgi:hypothetical protein
VNERCRVYWGTHGCNLERGHEGQHLCDCTCETHVGLDHPDSNGCVCAYPFYGPETKFYGEDVSGGPS